MLLRQITDPSDIEFQWSLYGEVEPSYLLRYLPLLTSTSDSLRSAMAQSTVRGYIAIDEATTERLGIVIVHTADSRNRQAWMHAVFRPDIDALQRREGVRLATQAIFREFPLRLLLLETGSSPQAIPDGAVETLRLPEHVYVNGVYEDLRVFAIRRPEHVA